MSHLELPAELLDEFVHPDIHSLFQHYSELYFDGELGHCSVEWSSGRMTRYVPRVIVLVRGAQAHKRAMLCVSYSYSIVRAA